ncbi:ADP-ribosylation factor, putative [Plasmodium vinckei brucechwatti]|uniref:ADP-ribosylation factor, putative n=1 Tax=Plasmodium vinckei brucechwatti TaxID=119398 RepID=A0A6V7RYP3_PLAVN|nr:ADP-ribosylation factor, putative [Plasmodium vinckei brucechwatti]
MGLVFSSIFSRLFSNKEIRILILGLDNADDERIINTKYEINTILKEPDLEGVLLVILANKQDVKNCLPISQISKDLNLTTIRDRQWAIFSTSATKNEGITEALDWLVGNLK